VPERFETKMKLDTRIRWTGCVEIGAWFTALLAIAGWGSRWAWFLDIPSHFRWQYALALMIGALTAIYAKRIKLGLFFGGLAVLNAWPLIIYANPWHREPPALAQSTSIRLVSVNVYSDNPTPQKVVDWVRATNADVVFLMEVTPDWEDLMQPLKTIYPHQRWSARLDNFGVALLSKVAPAQLEILELGETEVPTFRAVYAQGRESWVFYGTHPVPPGNEEHWRWRNEQLHLLARKVKGESSPVIVAGDFNATPYASIFQDFLKETGLRDSTVGRGPQNSWPVQRWIFRIPLDHVLVPPRSTVLRRELGPDVGSDHFPVLTEIVLPPNPAP
jgi:endonuclease/exonuclease/phosphatase (EEP) superfamily protein YafD